jgi:hypothetical protein
MIVMTFMIPLFPRRTGHDSTTGYARTHGKSYTPFLFSSHRFFPADLNDRGSSVLDLDLRTNLKLGV